MSLLRLGALALFFVLSVFFCSSNGQEDFYVSAPDVSTSYVFPFSPEEDFPVGEIAEVLVGFANNGKQTYNVTSVRAFLVAPSDFNYYVQNFTAFDYGSLVQAGSSATFAYYFRPNPLEPIPFGLTIAVSYQAEDGRKFQTAFFNKTVEITEPSTGFDPQTFFTYTMIIGVIGLLGFFVYQTATSGKRRSILSAPRFELGTKKKVQSTEDDDDWLKGTSAERDIKKRDSKKSRR
eukprot:TRINITY_DN761_c0_g1_i1.p1 TRINITY_DN761_c0_g1~~TRINITY_DN761_c0_g1_i1.p1  ORF type:complete len:258 (-),score=83.06 TRINITY_DN761_c0_g1_i1:128-829(-)